MCSLVESHGVSTSLACLSDRQRHAVPAMIVTGSPKQTTFEGNHVIPSLTGRVGWGQVSRVEAVVMW